MGDDRQSQFYNLSRGILCPHFDVDDSPHFLRIQSTHLEMKFFTKVLAQVGPDLLFHLANGNDIRIHDVSEKNRATRALWQGMPWVRFACERIWGLKIDRVTPPIMRNGYNALEYFENLLHVVPKGVQKQISYYKNYWTGERLEYQICTGRLVVLSDPGLVETPATASDQSTEVEVAALKARVLRL